MRGPEPGTEIDGFKLGECLHVGSMASIYRLEGLPLIMKIPRLGAGERSGRDVGRARRHTYPSRPACSSRCSWHPLRVLAALLMPPDSTFRLALVEPYACTGQVGDVKLLAVSHDSTTEALALGNQVVLGTRTVAQAVWRGGQDVSAQLVAPPR